MIYKSAYSVLIMFVISFVTGIEANELKAQFLQSEKQCCQKKRKTVNGKQVCDDRKVKPALAITCLHIHTETTTHFTF